MSNYLAEPQIYLSTMSKNVDVHCVSFPCTLMSLWAIWVVTGILGLLSDYFYLMSNQGL